MREKTWRGSVREQTWRGSVREQTWRGSECKGEGTREQYRKGGLGYKGV